MKQPSRRVRMAVAGLAFSIVAAGSAAVAILPGGSKASGAPAAHSASAPNALISICLTIKELHFGPECLVI